MASGTNGMAVQQYATVSTVGDREAGLFVVVRRQQTNHQRRWPLALPLVPAAKRIQGRSFASRDCGRGDVSLNDDRSITNQPAVEHDGGQQHGCRCEADAHSDLRWLGRGGACPVIKRLLTGLAANARGKEPSFHVGRFKRPADAFICSRGARPTKGPHDAAGIANCRMAACFGVHSPVGLNAGWACGPA